MNLECPKCGSDEVRLSRRRRTLGRILHLFGIYKFRCEECHCRFRANISMFRFAAYAKCPSCHRMDLSRWSRDYYNPPTLTRWMLGIGATPVRCEYCRNNFWSFRFIREKFSKEKRAARSHVVVPVRRDPDDETDPALASGQQKVVR